MKRPASSFRRPAAAMRRPAAFVKKAKKDETNGGVSEDSMLRASDSDAEEGDAAKNFGLSN